MSNKKVPSMNLQLFAGAAPTDFNSRVQKAIVNLNMLSNGGRLNRQQANKFIDMVVDQPTIINMVRTERMESDQKKIEKIGFGTRVLHPGTEGTDIGESNYSAPTTGTINLDSKEFIAVVKITDDTLENNIEKGTLEGHIMRLLSERVSLDLEELLVKGDTASSDLFLKTQDGLLKQITSNIVDANDQANYKDYFKNAKKSVPKKYMRDAKAFRFFTSYDVETEWQDAVGTLRSSTTGDDSVLNGSTKPAFGVPIQGIAMLDTYTSNGVSVSDSILTHPKNIIMGISRNIRIEGERKPRERASYFVLTLKTCFKLEEEAAAAKITKIKS